MSARLSSRSEAATPSVGSWAPLGIAALVASVLVLLAALHGPSMRETKARLQAEQIEQENRALCERLDMPHGSARFMACVDVLSEVRRQEAQRLASEAAGIL